MTKTHSKPEFQIIVQDQANAKFFVASFSTPGDTQTPPDGAPEGTTGSQASSYGNDAGGFEF